MNTRIASYEINPSDVLPHMEKYEAMSDEELSAECDRVSLQESGATLRYWKTIDPDLDLSREGLLDFIAGTIAFQTAKPI